MSRAISRVGLLVAPRHKRRWELYDLEQDRTETHDLASRFPERVHQLEKSWRRWAEHSEVFTLKDPESGTF